MNDTVKGAAEAATGSIESAAGDILGRSDLQARGSVKQALGRARRAIGESEHKAADAADRLSDAVTDVQDRVRGAYGHAADRLEAINARIVPFAREQSYAALGAAAAVGLLVGLLLAGRGSKVVYLRPPRP